MFLCLRTAATEKPIPLRWAAFWEVLWGVYVIAPVHVICVCGLLLGWPIDQTCFCWQNMTVSLCLLDYSFSLFLFHKSLEADGSAKGCLARNGFVIIKGTALCKWQGGDLDGENSFAADVL